jgi:hypothetical protein
MRLAQRMMYVASGMVWTAFYRGLSRPSVQRMDCTSGPAVRMTDETAPHAIAA